MRAVLRLLVVLFLVGLGAAAFGNFAERWVIYPFDPTEVSPETTGLSEVTARRMDLNGEAVVVWVAAPERGKPVILYFHGNAGNLAARAPRFRRFLERGYGLVAPAYPGSSGSGGTPDEDTIAHMAKSVWLTKDQLLPDAYGSPLAPRTVVYGESLGTAVAIALTDSLVHETPPAAVILEAPFTSIPALSEFHYPGTGPLAENLDNTWRSLERAKGLTTPLLILHGTQDALIPLEMGQQIFAAAPSEEKDMFVVKGAGHTDLWRKATRARLWRFIETYALSLR